MRANQSNRYDQKLLMLEYEYAMKVRQRFVPTHRKRLAYSQSGTICPTRDTSGHIKSVARRLSHPNPLCHHLLSVGCIASNAQNAAPHGYFWHNPSDSGSKSLPQRAFSFSAEFNKNPKNRCWRQRFSSRLTWTKNRGRAGCETGEVGKVRNSVPNSQLAQ